MELHEYEVRICVAGSRSYHDSIGFDAVLRAYVAWLSGTGVKSIAFISGDAKRGADSMIIEWARRHNYKCFTMKADWDKHEKAAGFIRNAEMRAALTHLLAFWDGESSGTAEMIDKTMEMLTDCSNASVIMVKPDSGWEAYKARAEKFKKQKDKGGNNNGWKSKGGRRRGF
jgi:hypothetical protein